MKKLFAMIVVCIMLTGCDDPHVRTAIAMGTAVNMVSDLKDCKTYRVSDGLNSMYIVRCSNSTTSTVIPGKTPVHTVTIDTI